MLFRDADVEVAIRMMRLEAVEAGAVRHGGGDGDDALVHGGELDHGVGENFGVSALGEGLGLAGRGIVGAEAMKFFLLQHGGLEAFALLREHVQQDWAALRLEKFEGLD